MLSRRRELAFVSKDKQDHGCCLSGGVCVSFIGFLYLYLCISNVCVYIVLVQDVIFVSEECVLCSDKGKFKEGP